jgi:tyrosyl-tRNA synthetase
VSMEQIEHMRTSANPLEAKKELGKRIVADFHSKEDAERVASSWGGLPPVESLEKHQATDARLNRALVAARFVNSVTEADKLIKGGSVALYRAEDGSEVPVAGPTHRPDAGDYIVRVGKKYKVVSVSAQNA